LADDGALVKGEHARSWAVELARNQKQSGHLLARLHKVADGLTRVVFEPDRLQRLGLGMNPPAGGRELAQAA
jgi:hypothetical protein